MQGGDRDGAAEAAQEARRALKRRLLPALGHPSPLQRAVHYPTRVVQRSGCIMPRLKKPAKDKPTSGTFPPHPVVCPVLWLRLPCLCGSLYMHLNRQSHY